jgi:translation initiation factor IF-1
MAKEGTVEMQGEVVKNLPNVTFRVRFDNGHVVLGYSSGKMRMHYKCILPGDKVTLELTPFDLTRGRITFQAKEVQHESIGISKAHVPQLQGCEAKWRGSGDMHGSSPQAAPRLTVH